MRYWMTTVLFWYRMTVSGEGESIIFSLSLSPPSSRKLIAEAWDAGGLYQVGKFPHRGVWSEWNGHVSSHTSQYLSCISISRDLHF